MTRRRVPTVAFLRRACLAVGVLSPSFVPSERFLAGGHEGHVVVALIAEHYMTPAALTKACDLLDGATIDSWRAGPRINPGCARVGFGDIGGQASASRTSSV